MIEVDRELAECQSGESLLIVHISKDNAVKTGWTGCCADLIYFMEVAKGSMLKERIDENVKLLRKKNAD